MVGAVYLNTTFLMPPTSLRAEEVGKADEAQGNGAQQRLIAEMKIVAAAALAEASLPIHRVVANDIVVGTSSANHEGAGSLSPHSSSSSSDPVLSSSPSLLNSLGSPRSSFTDSADLPGNIPMPKPDSPEGPTSNEAKSSRDFEETASKSGATSPISKSTSNVPPRVSPKVSPSRPIHEQPPVIVGGTDG